MTSIRAFLIATTVTALTACASTGIIKSGADTYMVSKTSLQVGFGPPTAVHAEISQEANNFCAGQGKKVEIVNTTITHPALGRPGSATLEFRCIAKETPNHS
jgi:ABC-type nitrate/sulfonate/bicarbonate transport system substrate-binding protein